MADRRNRREALVELLVRRSTEGLSREAEAELESLLVLFPDIEAQAYDRAAAAVWLAVNGAQESAMPTDVAARILARAGSAGVRDR